ncbi:ABC transporter substrate-binding protein [Nocardia callitridis]|uniref:ABC transporter substrate-binding protein n=1 Tax=Nocardia callitridis TaxID=648753 RepID=A0ABP9L5D3_9NOCA
MLVTTFRSRLLRMVAAGAVVGTVAAGCSSAENAAPVEITPGVTSTPCPHAIDTDKGCIYLGVLSDLDGGPFAALGKDMNDAQSAFWRQVNEAGGIGGRFEVDVTTYSRNTAYDARRHLDSYREIEPKVLALAMSLGTVQTQGVLDRMDAADMVATAGTLWSGWQFEDVDKGLVLESGYSYCAEAIIGLDWEREHRAKPRKIVTVSDTGDYGGDYSAGARKWAETNGVAIEHEIQTAPNAQVGNQDGPVAEILAAAPDLVLLATGPAEAGEIMGKTALAGFTGRFLGSAPTWNGGLLKTPAAESITAMYNSTSPLDGWDGTSTGAKRARQSASQEPTTWGYSAGWMFSYPMQALLNRALAEGKLDRHGVRESVRGLTVDYEGAIAPYTYGGARPDLSQQRAVITAPDVTQPLGARTLTTGYHGKTQEKVTLTEPCVRP